ncbi:hypothetical protein CCOS865_01847 [Pseudomonas reidholzensis]|uniref:Abortive phage resistance protein n=1 Tax=Pseudomonas reidholzensis TaxID=1785162 RepID=A0A383RS58_9PSED|nr:RloB family protein [Pseudomonas reidholzensis]SYX89593.1 hypothetical protein CCOS865_01847 [Pseudomonas reidholzensis]
MPKPRPNTNARVPRKMHVYCEGRKTEPNYLQSYINNKSDSRLRTVIRIEDSNKNTPVQLVEEAIRDKNSGNNPTGDAYWVVYDRESTHKYSDDLHEKAYSLAIQNNVNIALSNVCFEYWLLLHFISTNAPYASFDDLITQSVLKTHVRKNTGKGYEKGSREIFRIVRENIGDARTRALAINAQTLSTAPAGVTRPYKLNPYTGIPLLLDAIDSFPG